MSIPMLRRGALALVSALLTACGASSETVAGAAASAPTPAAAGCLQALGGIDVQHSTIPQIQSARRSGTLSSVALVNLYLQRIATFDTAGAQLNAVRTLAPDALAQAAAADARRTDPRPLAGIPVLLKDNVGTTDMPTTAGSIALALNIPKSEAFITQKLRAAGAIVLGKANLSEFANWVDLNMPNGYSSLGGQVISPYDFAADPLGSSTGSAVGGTMAYAAATIGTETSGSIIAPAYVHSMAAVKPTVGLVSRDGIIPLAPSFDTAGPITRTVTDAAVMLGVIAGVDPNDAATQAFANSALRGEVPDYVAGLSRDALKGARLGVRADDVVSTGPFADALTVLQQLGATIVPINDDPQGLDSLAADIELAAIFNEFKFSLNHYLATQAGPGLPVANLTDIVLYNQQNTDKVKYGQNLLILSDAQTGLEMDPASLAARTAAITLAQTFIDTEIDRNQLDAIIAPDGNNIGVTAAAGYPDLTVPMGYVGQVPHGLSFAGKAFMEARLLALAYAYEQATLLRQPATVLNPQLAAFCPNS